MLVFGLGRFGGGAAAARYLTRRGDRVRIADRATADELQQSVASLADVGDLEWCLASQDHTLLDGVDAMVCNPAVREDHPLVCEAKRRGITLTQEVNLFLEAYPGRVVVVTGTNGKSTTATLIAQALRCSDVATLLGGNIGHSLLEDVEQWREDQVAVLEISSFQLERVDPDVHRVQGAVFTRVTSDHLDRHGGLEQYHAAKARAASMARDFVVRASTDPVAAAFPQGAEVTLTFGAAATDDVTLRDGLLLDRTADRTANRAADRTGRPLVFADALAMPGDFQVENAMAAWLAAQRLGADRHAAGLALATERPLPHRLQLIASVDGRRIYDNAVSTQVESTLSALHTLRRLTDAVHWVGGGRSKDGEYRQPGAWLGEFVASAHLFGDAARPLGEELSQRVTTTLHENLEQALDAAWGACRAGEIVLFSPAFASFDQFPNFRVRAARFAAWVRSLLSADADLPAADLPAADRPTADAVVEHR
jgi:UDP-N-acetylmuramoylalanine--D-glutamate ligase